MVLKSTDSKTEPRGTLLITGLHQNTEPLTTTIWLHASRQFLILSLAFVLSGSLLYLVRFGVTSIKEWLISWWIPCRFCCWRDTRVCGRTAPCCRAEIISAEVYWSGNMSCWCNTEIGKIFMTWALACPSDSSCFAVIFENRKLQFLKHVTFCPAALALYKRTEEIFLIYSDNGKLPYLMTSLKRPIILLIA